MHRLRGAALAHADAVGVDARDHLDALRAQPSEQPLGQRGLLVREHARSALQHGHGDPEPRQRLRELDRDRSRADHHDARRCALEREDLLARQRLRRGEPVDRRQRRPAARREQDETRVVLLLPDDHTRSRPQHRRALEHVDAQRAEALGIVVGGGDVVLDRANTPPHARRVDREIGRRQPVRVRVTHRVRGLRRREQRLGGDAARPQAVAADTVALGARHADPERRGELGGDHAGRAHPDDDQVIARHAPPTRRYAGA